MKILTSEQATAIDAFFESFDLSMTGAWPMIEKMMREDWGIADPEAALEDAREALR